MPKSRKLAGGRSTTLKPAYEPIVLARRPPEGTVEANLREHSTGALNVEACRIGDRFPANVILSHGPGCGAGGCEADCALRAVEESAAASRARASTRPSRLFYCPKASRLERDAGCEQLPLADLDLFPNARNGSKASRAANSHPTVKPLELMRWLVRLIAPPGDLVLDPFCGSGSTGCGAALEERRFVGIEREPRYAAIARARIEYWASQGSR